MVYFAAEPAPAHPSFTVTYLNQRCLIQLPAWFTIAEAIAFKQQFQQVCEAQPTPQQIVLDFGQTHFMDSGGVGALVSCLKMAQNQGIALTFWSFSAQIQAVLTATGLHKVFVMESGTEATPLEANSSALEQPVAVHPSVLSKPKRLLDIAGGIVGLGLTGVLLIPIAIAIKLDSPGPIFFSQVRCGWMGKQFRLWKFRSMVADASALKDSVENQAEGAFFKNANDPRITRVGRFLRKTSLDEFPQFWNVLKGDMSLVGTRPPTLDELDYYDVPEWQRLDVKPGLTGEWQVNGRSKVTRFEDVIRLDLRYQTHWSLKYDLMLIWKTVLVLFRKDNGAV